MAKVMVHAVTGYEMLVPDELVERYQSWGHAVVQPEPQQAPKPRRAPRRKAAPKKEA